MKIKHSIVATDRDFVVVNKPAGLLCIPGRDPTEASLMTMLRHEFEEVYTVHRIDRDTSGLVIFALTRDAHASLSEQFEKRQVGKVYDALVQGSPRNNDFSLTAPLIVTQRGLTRVSPEGKPSSSVVKVQETFDGFSWLKVIPRTGRQHQIRVHLQHAGLPLIVDPLYHSSKPLSITDIKRRAKGSTGSALLRRTPLHAAELSLQLPSGERSTFTADMPKDMRAVLTQLRKWRQSSRN